MFQFWQTGSGSLDMSSFQGCLIASYLGSSQFFNEAHRKAREPGKINHVRDVRWKGLGVACAYTFDLYWEKCDGKTAGLSELELPGADMLSRAKTTRNFTGILLGTFHCQVSHARFLNNVHATASPFHLTSPMW